ncbi:MAG: tRNA dihydrouridine synthase DusB [Clostridia bacterium]|nr:MAG: tRNA dihydrouridine synthase DusB [Clostridia bacterium]
MPFSGGSNLPLTIGNVELSTPVLPAPMAGVSDKPFRLILAEFGCPLVYTEMVSAKGLVYGSRATLKMIDLAGEGNVAVQLFGREPEILARAAKTAVERGAVLIDLNLGCPMPKVVKNGEGAALMQEPSLVGELVAAVAAAVAVPVTVKMRSGWDGASRNAVQVALVAARARAKAVTVHGRTAVQRYAGRAEWDTIRQVAVALSSQGVSVIGNGDVASPEDASRMLAETGCQGVMVGRAAMSNPWIFPRISAYLRDGTWLDPPSPSERLAVARRHLDQAVHWEGEERAVRQMRKVIGWYVKGLPGAAALRQEVSQIREAEAMRQALHRYATRLH